MMSREKEKSTAPSEEGEMAPESGEPSFPKSPPIKKAKIPNLMTVIALAKNLIPSQQSADLSNNVMIATKAFAGQTFKNPTT